MARWKGGGGTQDITPLSLLRMQFCLAFLCLPLKNKLRSPEMNANLLAHREKATKSQISAHHNELKWSMDLSCSYVYNPCSLLEFTLHNYLRELRNPELLQRLDSLCAAVPKQVNINWRGLPSSPGPGIIPHKERIGASWSHLGIWQYTLCQRKNQQTISLPRRKIESCWGGS